MNPWKSRLGQVLFFHPWLKWILLPVAAIAAIGSVMSESAPAPL